MLGFIGQTVQGGWDALTNITAGIGKGASTLVSGFFPAPQREIIKSESVAPAEGSGMTYRPVLPENLSMGWTRNFANQDWIGSPYEPQFAVPAKIKEGQELAAKVSTEIQQGPIETFVEFAKWGTEQAVGIRTAANEFIEAWDPKRREPVSQGPKETGNSPGLIQYLNDIRDKTAAVLPAMKAAGGALLEQVKGLFNLGYEPTGSQPVFSIQHELDPKTKTTMMLAAGVIIVLLLLGRRK